MVRWWNNIEGCHLDEGWEDAIGSNKLHYYINPDPDNEKRDSVKSLCGRFYNHVPFFHKGELSIDIEDYKGECCKICSRILENRLKHRRLEEYA